MDLIHHEHPPTDASREPGDERACCRWLRERRAAMTANLRTLHTLGVNTPRLATMHFDQLSARHGSALPELLGNAPCPCRDAPDPDAYAALFSAVLKGKAAGDAKGALERFLDEYAAHAGHTTQEAGA